MVGHGDGATGALLATDGPELLEGRGTLDGRGVVALGDEDVVDAAVGGDGALVLSAGGGVVGTEVLDGNQYCRLELC